MYEKNCASIDCMYLVVRGARVAARGDFPQGDQGLRVWGFCSQLASSGCLRTKRFSQFVARLDSGSVGGASTQCSSYLLQCVVSPIHCPS